jgi:hypothetical protein
MFIGLLILIMVIAFIALVLAIALVIGLVMAGGVPFISTKSSDFNQILKASELKTGETIYDLGCGKANLLVKAVKEYRVKGIGYELSLTPYLWAQLWSWISGTKLKLYMRNFFKADLSEADVVFCYLFPKIMKKLEDKFEQELKPGSRVVSYAFKLPNRQPDKVIETNNDNPELGRIFLYKY